MRFNTLLIRYNTCCHDFFTHRLQPGLHYLVSIAHHFTMDFLGSQSCFCYTMGCHTGTPL